MKRKRKSRGGRRVEVDGLKFDSIKDACEHFGLDADLITTRIHRGETVQQAFGSERRGRRRSSLAKEFHYKGVDYPTGTALATAYSLDWRVVSRRLKKKWTVAQAVGDDPPPPRNRDNDGKARSHSWKEVRITADGRIEPAPDAGGYKLYVITNTKNRNEYVGITAGSLEGRFQQHLAAMRRNEQAILYRAMRKYGADTFTITLLRNDAKSFVELQQQEVDEIAARNTLRRGYNVALGGSLSTSKPITIVGVTFSSRAAAAEHYGVEPSVFNIRISRLKWTPEEAAGVVEKEWRGKAKSVVLSGIEYASLKAAAEALNKDYKTVDARIRRKWTLEQAFDLADPPESMQHRAKPVIFRGVKYRSMNKLAEAFGVYPHTIAKRLAEGKALRYAIREAVEAKHRRTRSR